METDKKLKTYITFLASLEGQHRLMYLLDISKDADLLEDNLKDDTTKIFGCLSNTYVKTYIKDNVVKINVSSDSLFMKGLLYLLQLHVSGKNIEEVKNIDAMKFMERVGTKHFSSSLRQNGFIQVMSKVKNEIDHYERGNTKSTG